MAAKEKLLRYQFIRHIAERRDEEGKPVPFRLEYICMDGTLLKAENVVTTSVNVRKKTRTVKFLNSGEVRTLHDVLIRKINDTLIVVS